jgi:hypothetical protein
MLFTTDQIIADVRSDLFDKADLDDSNTPRDTLWSDEDLLRYLNSAAARLASDTLALRKRFQFAVTANNPLVRFPYSEVIEEIRVEVTSDVLIRPRKLDHFDIDQGIEFNDYGIVIWSMPDLTRVGTPTHYTRDYDNTYMRIYPIPQDDTILVAYATVLPTELFAGMPLPFSTMQDKDLLLMWMKKLAYEKQDADTLDLARAKNFENEYTARAATRASEIDRIRRKGGLIQPAW